jgi:hypothetical protein
VNAKIFDGIEKDRGCVRADNFFRVVFCFT